MDNDDTVDLRKARADKFFDDLKAAKFSAYGPGGYKRIEDLVNWYLTNGYDHREMLFAFIYSAAAQAFRGLAKEDAEADIVETFVLVYLDLLQHGPHYDGEEYGESPTRGQTEKVYASLQAAIDRFKNGMPCD